MTPIDFKAAMEHFRHVVAYAKELGLSDDDYFGQSTMKVGYARAHLALLKAMWPGVVPEHKKRQADGSWSFRASYSNELGISWDIAADLFEHTTNMKVDDPELIKAMEGVSE